MVAKPLSQLGDEELMLQCQKGRTHALGELYNRFYRPLYGFIYRYVNSPDRVEDLLQEVFLRVYAGREKYQTTAKFSSWIYRIARNLCIDEKRRYWNRKVSLDSESRRDEDQLGIIETTPAKGPDSRQALEDKELGEQIYQAINTLSAEQREVVIMHKYQEMSYKEIADILDISVESVKQRAYRAHQRLRELLAPVMAQSEL